MSWLGALSLANPATPAGATLSKLGVLAAAFGGTAALKAADLPKILGMISGSVAPSPELVRWAKRLAPLLQDENRRGLVWAGLLGLLETQGVTQDGLLDLLRKVLPMAGLEAPKTPVDAMHSVFGVVDRIAASPLEEPYQTRAIVTCPVCSYTHLI